MMRMQAKKVQVSKMNWKRIWELTKINLLYSNPQALAKVRKKNAKNPLKKPKEAYKSILFQQLAGILLYSFIFIYLFSALDYRQYPGYFSFQIFMFFLMSVTSAFSTMFSVFYNSHDTKLYLPLPVTEREIYLAKLLSSVGLNLTFLMPTLSLFIIGYWRIFGNGFLAVPFALLQFIILALLSIFISNFLVHVLGRLLMKLRQKNMISTALMLLSTFGAVGMILFMQNMSLGGLAKTNRIPDLAETPVIVGFYHIARAPFSSASLLHYGILLVLLVVFGFLMIKKAIPQYYQQLAVIDSKKVTIRNKKIKANTSLQSTMIRHHLGTLKDPTLIMTSVMSTFMFVMFFVPQLLYGNRFFSKLPLEFFGVVLLVGLALGYMTSGAFTMVGMSLEREQFYFLKALPFDFHDFLRQKFVVLWVAQTAVPVLTFGIFSLVAGLHPFLIFILVLGILLASYPTSLSSYKRDYKHLTLTWQNVSQLFNRGGGQLLMMLLWFLSLLLSASLGVAIYFLSLWLGAWKVSFAALMISFAIVFALHFYYEKSFWEQFK